jgi:hypothetical protein
MRKTPLPDQTLNNSTWYSIILTVADVLTAAIIILEDSDRLTHNPKTQQKEGSNVIHHHSSQNSIVPSGNSPRCHRGVLRSMAAAGNYSASQTEEDVYHLFTIPGMDFCSSGDGAWLSLLSPHQPLNQRADTRSTGLSPYLIKVLLHR